LEMERLSHAPRLTLLNMRIELATSQVTQSKLWVGVLQDQLNKSLAEEAKKARQATDIAKEGALGEHPVVRKEAEYNSKLSLKLEKLTDDIERIIEDKGETATRLNQIKQNWERSQQQVEIVGLDEPLGELLLAQNRSLPDVRQLDLMTDKYRREMSLVRAQQFRLSDELQQFSDDKMVTAYIAKLYPAGMSQDEMSAFEQAMQKLIQDRVQLLDKLLAEYARYESALSDLSLEQHQLRNEVAGYQQFLNKNLVWIPSAPPLGLADIRDMRQGLEWLFSRDNWGAVASKLNQSVRRYPGRVVLVIIIVIALIRFRRNMLSQMEAVLPKIGRVNQDRFRFSVVALLYTFLLALPPPLVMGGVGWLLYKDEPSTFAWAVGMGALTVSTLYLVLRFGRYLVMPNGLARNHLRWDPYAIGVYAQILPWFTRLFVLAVFIASLTGWELDEGYWNSLGRVASITTTLMLLWFAHISLNPNNGALSRSRHVMLQGLRLKMLWYPLAIVLGLLLLFLTIEGYHYTAIVLKRLLFASFTIGVIILLLHSFARRWLLIAERRLALKRARAKREAAQEAKAAKVAADAAGEGVPEAEELEEINLTSISEQTQRLLRVLGAVSFFVAMFFLWSILTPALGGLDEIILWQRQAPGMGDAVLISVSVWDLLMAVLVIVLMLVAVRNLPGLLEIAILQPLALELGNRYAVTMISRYLILASGFIIALNMLGVNWGDVQWLVAAMGVGLGFGLKEIFANFFSGLIILFERPVRIGDTVTLGELSGTVTRIRIRATTVTDWDNKEQVIPNQNFLINPLINWTLSDPITRVVIKVGIAYGSDTEKALQIMTDVVMAHPEVMDEPRATVFFVGFGDSSLDFEARVFVRDRVRRVPLRHDLHMALDRALREAGIEIPFPQRDLHIRSIAPGLELRGKESD
ncbi:MAG: mechanosensitive ion channel, partial [Gammaproteobacteria bacterium]